MRRVAISLALPLCVLATPLAAQVAQNGSPADASRPPSAAKQPKVSKIHGYTRVDDYFWLRDKNNPAVRQYLEGENAYTAAMMKPTEPLQQRLYDEMVARVKQTDETAPYRKGDWVYWSRTIEGKQYSN